MLPLTFDRRVLSSPLLDYEDSAGRVMQVLRAIVERRVLPSFAAIEDVDPVQLARASERYSLSRLEESASGPELVSLAAVREGGWTIHIHERIFDYFGFGLPLKPNQAFDDPNREARKILALAEFALRHEFHHLVHPHCEEREVLHADCAFIVRAREHQQALHDALMEAFTDTTNGLRVEPFLDLLRRHEAGAGFDEQADRMVRDHLPQLCRLPEPLLVDSFLTMATPEKELLLDACYRLATDPSLPVARRADQLRSLVAVFRRQRREDVEELRRLFESCVQRWSLETFLREIEVEIPDTDLENTDAVFERFVHRLAEPQPPAPPTAHRRTLSEPTLESPMLVGERPPEGSLKERIEAARDNPLVPRSVIRAIDTNLENLSGHSKAKYTEFIETLLAVPWGVIRPIEVGPREFAAGLDATHFGLEAPKELVADFFTNLIWRYRDFDEERAGEWHRTGSAFLFVGPPGVGKTSLAISIAKNLDIPYHKVSLGGMRDESALRGHGFTYEGSKPGAIVQGLLKMAAMNGMFILDEADKTETFAIATLLEILDPEQNHLFHDKYTLTTVDIDLSNCHFILTANTLDTVPAPVIDRCQVVLLDRYSIEEKVEIARRHILPRLRELHDIAPEMIDFEDEHEQEHLRFLIRTYTHEAGVRQLELVLRKLLLRLQRRLQFEGGAERVEITHQLIREHLYPPARPATINSEDRVGEMLALGVNTERGIGSVIPVQATRIAAAGTDRSSAISMVHATGNLEKVMDESRRVATTAILHCACELGIDPERTDEPVHLHFMGGSTPKDGPSAGVAIALALGSLLSGQPLRRDVAATGEIDTQGRVTGVGGLDVKLETAVNAGCKTLIIPRDNLSGPGGVGRLPESLRNELQVLRFDEWRDDHEPFDPERHTIQVVAVEHVRQAFAIAVVDEPVIAAIEARCVAHAREVAASGIAEQRCPVALLVKEAGEVDDEHFHDRVCADCPGCRVLVPSGSVAEIAGVVKNAGGPATTHELGDGPQAIRAALAEVIDTLEERDGPMAIVAPYFALKEAGLDAEQSPRELVLFANNWAAPGYKLKGLKPLINRTVCRLLHLEPKALESFPLLCRRGGVWVADLSLVPEKYRLEPCRCEELLTRFLTAWLEALEGSTSPPVN